MSSTTLQLRVGVTRDKGFLYRACLRPPASVTVGRDDGALLPLQDDEAPPAHTLFSLGDSACLLDFRPEWNLRVFRDGLAVTGQQLMEEGLAFRRGRRVLLQMAPGTRGSLRIGRSRLLFKWEAVPITAIGEVPLVDVGGVPRCHACGLALRDALAKEGLYARCDDCRAVCRFSDPDGKYRSASRRPVPHNPIDDSRPYGQLTDATDSQVAPQLQEEADTSLGLPIFAPRTNSALEPLPEHLRPAGLAGRPPTPIDIRAARAPLRALEGMKTVFARSPFLGPRPHGRAAPPGGPPPPAIEVPAVKQRLPVASDMPDDTGTDEVDTDSDAAAPIEPLEDDIDRSDGLEANGDQTDGNLDEAFWTAELEALPVPVTVTVAALKPRPAPPADLPPSLTDPATPSDDSIPWSTFSVLSAQADYAEGAGRIPHQLVSEALEDEDWKPRRSKGWALLALLPLAGCALVLALLLQPDSDGPPIASNASPLAGDVRCTDPRGTRPPDCPPAPDRPAARATREPPSADGPRADPGRFQDRRVVIAASQYRRPADDGTSADVSVAAFHLDRTEVTLGDFRSFLAETQRDEPSGWSLHPPPVGAGTADLPVAGVSAADAAAFCHWAGGRLPREVEWERAAVGAEGRTFPWGEAMDATRASIGRKLEAVGSYPGGASDQGVLDLIGGVPEWVDTATEPVLKGGGVAPWNEVRYLAVFPRILPGAERWTPGPGFRCVGHP